MSMAVVDAPKFRNLIMCKAVRVVWMAFHRTTGTGFRVLVVLVEWSQQ